MIFFGPAIDEQVSEVEEQVLKQDDGDDDELEGNCKSNKPSLQMFGWKMPSKRRFSAVYQEMSLQKPAITRSEHLYLIANRIHETHAYTVFYMWMILLNVTLLLVMALNSGVIHTLTFVVCEGIITTLLFFEIFLKVLTLKGSYWSKCSNWFDIFVFLLCIVSIIIYAHLSQQNYSESEDADEIVMTLLLVVRHITQLLRLVALVRQKRRIEVLTTGIHHSATDEINFSQIDPDFAVDLETGVERLENASDIEQFSDSEGD